MRLLNADPAAGFEAPIPIDIYENTDGTATISYVPPSVVHARDSRGRDNEGDGATSHINNGG